MEEPVKTTVGQGFGIASLILGILAIAFIPRIGIFALLPGIIAIVLAIVGLTQARSANGTTGLIISGLVISIIGTLVVVWLLFFSASGLFLKNLNKSEKEYRNEIESDFDKTDSDLEKTLEELEKKDSLDALQQGAGPDSIPDSSATKE